jgi:hypothetical protein
MRRHATGLLVPVQLLTPISCMVAPGRAAEGTEVLAGGWGGGEKRLYPSPRDISQMHMLSQ